MTVVVAAACLLVGAPTAGSEAPRIPWPPALVVADSTVTDPAITAYLKTDLAWLARVPSWRLTAPAAADSAGLLEWLQRFERSRLARIDTTTTGAPGPVRGHRAVTSELRDRWLSRGYLDAAVVVRAAVGERPALVTIDPGLQYRLGELAVTGDPFPERDRILATWLPRAGDPFQPTAYEAAVRRVVADCAEVGYPFPAWLTQSVTRDPETQVVAVEAMLLAGPRAFVGRQATNLPPGRSSRFVIRAAGLRTGALFREDDLQRGIARLQARDLYARVDEPLVHLTTVSDTVGVVWRVLPQPRRNRVAVVLGLSRQADASTRLSGQVDLDLPDLGGTGRRLSARWSDDGQDRSRFGFSYLEPLVLGTPLDTDLTLDSEVEKDSYTRFRFDNRWRMSVVDLWGVEVGLGWDRSTYPEGDLERTTRTRGRVALLHNRGDRSRSGWSAVFAVETAHRRAVLRLVDDPVEGSSAVRQTGSQVGQRLLEADLTGELWLTPTISLAARSSFRQIDTDAKPVPLPEQYRFGGAMSVRGYSEDAFRGETAAWGGGEVRLGRVHRSRVYTFMDVGYFEFSSAATDGGYLSRQSGTEIGYGLGLRTDAAAGQIDLAVGFPGSVTFDTAKLHVSLVGSF